ncbi:coronin-1A-like isoform X2 [Paramacrobiotus metropolitanus]|uniref:coronin-1A-like isoform X2 n=1 Tax=Paramacrobiotus metropolitanus TaxID=2943436 RepID=UPI002445D499|nr:coronin-1A-like isoform X2 [Paramacrobiotus metropolitanus]
MSFRIRPSKFRHVYGDPAKKPLCYENIRISKNAHDTYFACVNPKFLAVITESAGGGSFQVLPLEKVGRIDLDFGKVSGHTGPVLDIKFDPFNDNVIASASEDCSVKIWHIPDGGVREMRDALVTLQGHQRRVVQLEWHPIAEHILLSAGGDSWVIVWDVGRGDAVRVIDCHRDVVCSMGFNFTGSLFATTCRDLQIRLIEPRMASVAQTTPGHAGSKPSKLAFVTNKKKLFTTGFSKYSDRQFALWDVNNLSQPIKMDIMDSSSGVVFPYYDPDTSVVYLAGRGDGNIRYYEVTDTLPYLHYLSQYQSTAPQRSVCAMPKRGLNFNACEIWRFYKLYATKNYVEPISMIAPRKSGLFHEDLFPDTAGPTPALTTEEWLNGNDAKPVLISLKSNTSLKTSKPVMYKADENQLITSDRNNELKFRFIAETAQVDYRPLSERKTNKHANGSNGADDTENKSNKDFRPRSLYVAAKEDQMLKQDNRGDRFQRHRFSWQGDPPAEFSGDGSHPNVTIPSRSFQSLQRMWNDRQNHSLDHVSSSESPTPFNGHPFVPLLECAEEGESELRSTPVQSVSGVHPAFLDAKTLNGHDHGEDVVAKRMSDERNDKENRNPHSSESPGPQIYKMYLEQKETICCLQRELKLKEEENFRLRYEIEMLKARYSGDNNPLQVEKEVVIMTMVDTTDLEHASVENAEREREETGESQI